MGVTSVVQVPVPEGKSAHQVVDGLRKKLELLGAVQVSSWTIDCETHQSTQLIDGAYKVIHIFHASEQANLAFSILENDLCVVADAGFDSIMSKLKAFYMPKKGGKISVQGTKYEFGDFSIKVGNITQASSFRGIVLEGEYRPCSDPRQCWALLTEFMSMLLEDGSNKNNQPTSFVDKKLSLFCFADTILQYHHLISSIKKSP